MQAIPNLGPLGYGQPTAALPMLPFDYDEMDQAEYSAYLQDRNDDLGYLAGESSESAMSPSSGTGFNPSLQLLAPRQQPLAPGAALTVPSRGKASQEAQAAAKQRLERRGHTKSRRGCFNCKRRRIKCQETRPACGHCVKQGLKCEYPALPRIVHQPQHQIPVFSLQDMRFFHHFLTSCYPHHPIGSEELWTHEIPCLSEKYEYLMHAILGYSASELMASDRSLAEAAMSHRLKAIKAIKKSLSGATTNTAAAAASSGAATLDCSSSGAPSSSSCPPGGAASNDKDVMFEEGNALMATCVALTYQSVLLDDGMAEYLTFIRGVMIVAIQMYIKGATILFGDYLLGDRQKEVLQPHMEGLPLIDAGWTEQAVRAVEGLRGLVEDVEGREVESRYWELIMEIGRMLSVSSWKAYIALTEFYTWWMMLPHEKFQALIDPGNQVAILLATHWISVEQIMATITEAELKGAAKMPSQEHAPRTSTGNLGNLGWLQYLNSQVDSEHLVYNQWPVWVEEQRRRDRGCFGRTIF
ncbi:hypothetical protein N658DRAFT_495332 [Parathielavia hyrcaniae]|uniref:Zn(2)-C6 fungal-type domain-containing protein n=1 Tax=Parathielavia hyrcaniae TaxID=113614 RepID=A0AAN6Q5J0_9PEZI|nr:hypothetical protein N658DRAFT_495332 [Parathielavia hyrcaniae]